MIKKSAAALTSSPASSGATNDLAVVAKDVAGAFTFIPVFSSPLTGYISF